MYLEYLDIPIKICTSGYWNVVVQNHSQNWTNWSNIGFKTKMNGWQIIEINVTFNAMLVI